MRLELKIVGRSDLYFEINRTLEKRPSASRGENKVDWAVSYVATDLSLDDLVSLPESPTILIVEADNFEATRRISALARRVPSFVRENPGVPLFQSPVICLVNPWQVWAPPDDFAVCVTDWAFLPINARELQARSQFSLQRSLAASKRLDAGGLVFIDESYTVMYERTALRLSRTEFILAKLFCSKIGAVISFPEIQNNLATIGKSADKNNIRVLIYHLRMKIEDFTRGNLRLESVYRQGYCLRKAPIEQRAKPITETGFTSPDVIHGRRRSFAAVAA